MPRFLNTWTGEFEWHDNPAKVRYAILSHVWRAPKEGGEQSFDDVRRLQESVKTARDKLHKLSPADRPPSPIFDMYSSPFPNNVEGIFFDDPATEDPRTSINEDTGMVFSVDSPLSDKIKGLCKVAREAGFRLVWNDACCIDKSSSAELSEAINSMYEWYRLSDMCYVYLADVPEGDIPQSKDSWFRKSRWHKRGWTLQELLAAERIDFFTSGWNPLGTKLGLVSTLAEVTGIDVDILTGRAPLDSASVAQRMSWAAMRSTTRVEDQAYSLMGIFGVHMPPIYGEGQNAFFRLQEEIIRTIPDQSIFAWGKTCILTSQFLVHGLVSPHFAPACPALLAPSPSYFQYSTVRPVAPAQLAAQLRLQGIDDTVPSMDCGFAPQGARIRLLCLDLTQVPRCDQIFLPEYDHRYEDCTRRPGPEKLALLQCEDGEGNIAALPLHSSSTGLGSGHGRPVGTYVPCRRCSSDEWRLDRSFHTVHLSRAALAQILVYVAPETVELSILRHYSDPPISKVLQFDLSLPPLDLRAADHPSRATFVLAPRSITGLRALGFTASPLQVRQSGAVTLLETVLTLRDEHSGSSNEECFQSIRLSASLDQTPSGSTSASRAPKPRFRFSIANFLSVSTEAPSSRAPYGFPTISAPYEMKEVPCFGDSERVQEANIWDLQYKHTLAYAEFLVPSYPERPRWIRLLRLSLERSLSDRLSSAPRNPKTFWMAIELSAEYEHTEKAQRASNVPGHAKPGEGSSRLEDDARASVSDAHGEDNVASLLSSSGDPQTSVTILMRSSTYPAHAFPEWYMTSDDSTRPSLSDTLAASHRSGDVQWQPGRDSLASFEHFHTEETRPTLSRPEALSVSSSFTSQSTTSTLFDEMDPSNLYVLPSSWEPNARGLARGFTTSASLDSGESRSRGKMTPQGSLALSHPDDTVSKVNSSIAALALSRSADSMNDTPPFMEACARGVAVDTPTERRSWKAQPSRSSTERGSPGVQLSEISVGSVIPQKRRRSASVDMELPDCRETKKARAAHSPPAGTPPKRSLDQDESTGMYHTRTIVDSRTREGRTLAHKPVTDAASAGASQRVFPNSPPASVIILPTTPSSPRQLSVLVSESVNTTTADYTTIEDSTNALLRENSALRAQVSTATSQNAEMASEVAALSVRNAALVSQMAAMQQRFDPVAGAATATASPFARMDAV